MKDIIRNVVLLGLRLGLCFGLLLGLCLGLFGCATATKSSQIKAPSLAIETKMQIKDLKKNETHNIKIEIVLLTDQAVRMEVSALFGYSVASVLMTSQKIKYALHTSKKYVEGAFTAKTFFPVFKQNIDPLIIWNAVHNRSPQSPKLECKNDIDNKPLLCMSSDGVKVTWVYEDSVKRRIEIKSPNFEMIWVFKDQKAVEASLNETFVLNKPAEYQHIQIK